MAKGAVVSSRVKQKNPKNKRNKTTLVFDEKAREEFLTGFRKRKIERRKVAQEKIIARLKEEKKKLKLQKREDLDGKWRKLNLHCNLDVFSEPVTYDLAAHTVTVSDISQVDFAGTSGVHLGINQGEDTEEPTTDRLAPPTEDAEDTDEEDSNTAGSSKKKHAKHSRSQNKHKNLTHLMSKKNMSKKKQSIKKEQSGPLRKTKKKKSRRRN